MYILKRWLGQLTAIASEAGTVAEGIKAAAKHPSIAPPKRKEMIWVAMELLLAWVAGTARAWRNSQGIDWQASWHTEGWAAAFHEQGNFRG